VESEDNVFCSLFKPLKDMDICFDISGETPQADVNLIGYKCTGKWNQIYKLSDNCTITAEQPGLIGRVRGFGEDAMSFCLTGGRKSFVSTAQCEHAKSGTVVATQNTSNEVVSSIDGSTSASDSIVAMVGKTYAYSQQFEFMPISGNAYKKYGAIRDKA